MATVFHLLIFWYIELLIQSYYNIVKRTMIDMVPKAVMLNLVSRAKEGLQGELLAELYKADVLDDLLQESEFTQQRRKECKKMIEVGNCFTLKLLSVSLLTLFLCRLCKKRMRLLDQCSRPQESTTINTPT